MNSHVEANSMDFNKSIEYIIQLLLFHRFGLVVIIAISNWDNTSQIFIDKLAGNFANHLANKCDIDFLVFLQTICHRGYMLKKGSIHYVP